MLVSHKPAIDIYIPSHIYSVQYKPIVLYSIDKHVRLKSIVAFHLHLEGFRPGYVIVEILG